MFTRIFYATEILLTASISVYRLYVVKRVGSMYSILLAKIYLVLLAIVSGTPTVLRVAFLGKVPYFDPYALGCTVGYEGTTVTAIVFIIIPMIMIILCNIRIIYIVYKQAMRLKKHTTENVVSGTSYSVSIAKTRMSSRTPITLISVCCLFVITYFPIFVFSVFKSKDYIAPMWFYVFVMEFISFNVAGNPVVYALTNTRFRKVFMEVLCLRKY